MVWQLLEPQYCKIIVGGAYSDPRELAYSVPQASCVGLVLKLSLHLNHLGGSTPRASRPPWLCRWPSAKDTIQTRHHQRKQHNINSTKHHQWHKECMDSNCLKMNSSKTEYIIYVTHQQLAKCMSNSININGIEILKSDCINTWGCGQSQLSSHDT